MQLKEEEIPSYFQGEINIDINIKSIKTRPI